MFYFAMKTVAALLLWCCEDQRFSAIWSNSLMESEVTIYKEVNFNTIAFLCHVFTYSILLARSIDGLFQCFEFFFFRPDHHGIIDHYISLPLYFWQLAVAVRISIAEKRWRKSTSAALAGLNKGDSLHGQRSFYKLKMHEQGKTAICFCYILLNRIYRRFFP